jgi:isopenicillin N synthase-like dioxygenase
MSDSADLPIVDLGSSLASDALRRGLLETGFFYLRDHEIPDELLESVREVTAAFYALPLEEKQKHEGFLRGYVALRAEDTESGFGTGEYGGGDLCEKYTMGYDPTAADRGEAPGYYDAPEAGTYFGPNVFPNPDFARVWVEYFGHMQALSRRLMAAVRATLGLPTDAWECGVDRPADVMRFLHYPEVASEGLRMAAHYDDNLLTLLHQSTPENGFAALEVMLPREDVWRPVEPDDRYFVVNVGDSLMYLTEGRAIATKHRVVNPPPEKIAGGARTSLVFAHLPNWNCPLRPVAPAVIDHSLGQARDDFGVDALRDPDGTVPYYRLQQRESQRGFNK